jgi:hypothetical protein
MDLPKPRIAKILEEQGPLLDEIFGEGPYEIEERAPYACVVRSPVLEIRLAYDWRDQWVSSIARPLNVPPDVAEDDIIESWARFVAMKMPARRKSQLDERQVVDELEVVRAVAARVFTDAATARDAACFVRGYRSAYNDWAKGGWR